MEVVLAGVGSGCNFERREELAKEEGDSSGSRIGARGGVERGARVPEGAGRGRPVKFQSFLGGVQLGVLAVMGSGCHFDRLLEVL